MASFIGVFKCLWIGRRLGNERGFLPLLPELKDNPALDPIAALWARLRFNFGAGSYSRVLLRSQFARDRMLRQPNRPATVREPVLRENQTVCSTVVATLCRGRRVRLLSLRAANENFEN